MKASKIISLFALIVILLCSNVDAKCSMSASERPFLRLWSGYGSTRTAAKLRESVKDVQSKLNELNGAGLGVDGYFGPLTDQAVRSWQRKKGLSVDGIVGRNTWSSLCASQPTNGGSNNQCVATRNPHPSDHNCYGFTPRALHVQKAIDDCFGEGTYYCRDWTSNKSSSEHIGGNAMDCRRGPGYHNAGQYYRGEDKAALDTLYEWLKTNANDLKLSNVIWYGKIWSQSRPYDHTCCGGSTSATYGHFDHLHFKALGPHGGC